jgi:hypothetical protein
MEQASAMSLTLLPLPLMLLLLQDEDKAWADRRAAEAEVVLAVEAAIWDGLLADTAAVLAAM